MIGLVLALLIMLVGLAGSIVPVIPGSPLVLVAAIGHRLYFGPSSVSNLILVILIFLVVVSLACDLAASALGAKKFGSTWRGAVGAVIGGVIGIFFSIPGIILGPFLGATIFEMLGDKEFKHAVKSGAGAVAGLLLGVVGKFVICVVMIGLFATNVIIRSLSSDPPAPQEIVSSGCLPDAQSRSSQHRLVPQADKFGESLQPG
jgi:uncharacterized protein YqgC (DUF456 family)